MAEERVCKIEGCCKTGKMRVGMCAVHYGRRKRHGDPLGGRRYPERGGPQRFLRENMWLECPKWPFARGRGGYGRIQHDGKVVDVHRLVCEIVHGAPPTSEHVAAHNCGKGHLGCFGAACITWKTKSENQQDRHIHGTAKKRNG